MRTSGISTFAQTFLQRTSIQRAQSELVTTQIELGSGQVSDISRALGARTGQYFAIEASIKSLESNVYSNTLVEARLRHSETGLEGVARNIQEMQELLIQARGGALGRLAAVEETKSLFARTLSQANTVFDGAFVFSGINAQSPALYDYFSNDSLARASVEASFVATFGFDRSDPAVDSITPGAMADWLDNEFAGLFQDSNWIANWSGASEELMEARIDDLRTIENGVSASDPALRKMIMAYVMMSDVGAERMNSGTFNILLERSVQLLGDATVGVQALRTSLGLSIDRVEQASQHMNAKKRLFSLAANEMVSRDPYELSLKINEVRVRLEASYSITARMRELSLLRFI